MSEDFPPSGGLMVVRGAELIDRASKHGWVVWPGWERRSSDLQLWERTWRFVGPSPLRILPGERFKYATRSHWIVLFKDFLWMALAWPVLFIVSFLYSWVGLPSPWQLQLVMWASMVVHQILMVHKMLAWRAKLFVITDKRLVVVGGVFSNKRKEYNLQLYTNFSVNQPYHCRLLGYGMVRIEMGGSHNAGADDEFLMYVPDPDRFCDELHTYVSAINEYLAHHGAC